MDPLLLHYIQIPADVESPGSDPSSVPMNHPPAMAIGLNGAKQKNDPEHRNSW